MRKHPRHTSGHVYGDQDRTWQGATITPSRRAARRAMTQIGAVVYAVRTADGLIKIGHTTRLDERCYELHGDPVAVMFGTRADEQAIHERLVDHVHHGREWYYPTPGVMAVVNEMRAALGLEPVAA